MIFENNKLAVYSILVSEKDENRIVLDVKYSDFDDKITDKVNVLIDRKNNLVWMDNELNYNPALEKVIRELIII